MKKMIIATIVLIVMLESLQMTGAVPIRDLVIVDSQEWFWVDDTYIVSTAVGDVDGDGSTEIVTGGYYYDGTRNRAQLCVWTGSTLALEDVRTWHWVGDTGIESVAVGDVDADGSTEIVTGGWHSDGVRWIAQLAVWNGATLALEDVRTWYWISHTVILSVACADVDGDGSVEIVTGGYYYDGTRDRAQLCVWDGSTLSLEGVETWYWTGHTYVKSVAIGCTGLGVGIDVVTGGYFYAGGRENAQLCVWDGATLALEGVTTWYWTGNTQISSVLVDDFDLSAGYEIVTGGWFWDGTRFNAQVCVWQGHDLTLDYPAQYWYTEGDTKVYSVALGDWDGDFLREVIAGGSHWDPFADYGYVAEIWSGEFFADPLPPFKGWGCDAQESWVDSIYINSVATSGAMIYTGGASYDGFRYRAHLGVWTAD